MQCDRRVGGSGLLGTQQESPEMGGGQCGTGRRSPYTNYYCPVEILAHWKTEKRGGEESSGERVGPWGEREEPAFYFVSESIGLPRGV